MAVQDLFKNKRSRWILLAVILFIIFDGVINYIASQKQQALSPSPTPTISVTPAMPTSSANQPKEDMCGGIAGKICPTGYSCEITGDYPDASGTCKKDLPRAACTMEAKQCPNGTFVGREGPNCEFAACPE